MLSTITLFTILGTKFFTIPINEWDDFIRSDSNIIYTNRSAIGGLLLGLIGLLFSFKFFGFNRNILDLYAWVTPISVGIAKMGCFFNGCCYGNTTSWFWGISYPRGTWAYHNHWSHGLIGESAGFSLNVVPVQLLETIMLLSISFIVWKTYKVWKKTGSSLIFSLFLFFIFRFVFVFIRNPNSSNVGIQEFFGVRAIVWFLAIFTMFLGLLLLVYEKKIKMDFLKTPLQNHNLDHIILYILILCTLVYFFRNKFTAYEFIGVEIRLIPAILFTGYFFIKTVAIPRQRFGILPLLVLSIFLMSQSIPTKKEKPKGYTRVDIGTSFGEAYNTVRVEHPGAATGCGTGVVTIPENYKHRYAMGGVGISRVSQKNKLTFIYGINMYYGSNREFNLTRSTESKYDIRGFNPYIKTDWNWIGFGFGFHAGSIRYIPGKTQTAQIAVYDYSGTEWRPVFPDFYGRIGRRDIVFLEFDYGFNGPASPFPSHIYKFGIGSGFGQKTDYSFMVGITTPNNTPFISVEGLILNNFGVNAIYTFGNSEILPTKEKTFGRFVFGVNYRFGDKK